MKPFLKWGVPVLIFAVLLSGGYELYYSSIGGFRLGNVVGDFYFDPAWNFKPEEGQEDQAKKLLNQPYRYIGKGGQAYAFESEDKRYVLKLLKFKYLRPKVSYKLISYIPFLEDKLTSDVQARQKKFYRLYQGYKWAYELNRQHSGLIYLHFNPTFNEFGSVIIYDKLGRKHKLELDQVAFIIQERGILLDQLLDEKITQGNIDEAQSLINRFFEATVAQYNKGLYDTDYGLVHNTGFVGDRPIHIDMGRITFDIGMKEKSRQNTDLQLILARLEKWLHKNHPRYASDLIVSAKDNLNQQFGLLEPAAP